jgi:two-component system cell cycle sensor histidine kinase PleC
VVVDGKSRPVAATPFDESLLREVISSLPPNASSSPVLRYIERNGSNYLASAIHVPGYDLRLISVARAADALSNWYDSLPLYTIMIFGPSLLGAALAWALLNQIEQTSRSDTALRRTEERFELAVSGAKCGIWDWDFVNRRMYWSGAMNALVGRGKQPRIVPVEEIEQLLHPEDRNVVASIENAIRSGASTYDESFRIRHQDGQYVWIRAKGQMYRTLRSETGRLSGIVLDISDQKSAVDRLNVAEKVLKTAFENAAEAFVLWDREGRLIMCNRRFMDFYGLSEARIGDSRTRLLARAKPHDQGVDDAPLELYDAKGGTGTIELQQVGDRWLLVSERKAMDNARIMVATDITSLKQHEDELKLSRNRLHEQTVKLSDIAKTLEVEKLRAEEGNRSKTEFLANMSHELRTPLNAIIGFSDVMRNEMLGPLPQRYVEYATDIHRSGQHLLHLIDEVLNMARIDSGGMKLDLETLDVGALIGDCLKSFEAKAKDANITFRTELRTTPAIQADKRALREVLSNLLSNALKYNSRDGFVTIETRMMGDAVSVWIHDTGVGITPANLPRVIKPFERLESATNANKKGGTGLGLAVSNALIEMHGGKLVIESEVDVGTSVYFTLPVAAA